MTEIILVMNGHMAKSYQKLIKINDTKHTKMFISRPFGNLLDLLSVGDLYFVFAHGAHKSVGKKIFFLLSG